MLTTLQPLGIAAANNLQENDGSGSLSQPELLNTNAGCSLRYDQFLFQSSVGHVLGGLVCDFSSLLCTER